MLEEKTSKHLGVPFIELDVKGKKYYLCYNGVIFSDAEYMDFADLNAEYERRAKEDKLYDYAYAKSTGLLRKKRNYAKDSTNSSSREQSNKAGSLEEQNNEQVHKESLQEITPEVACPAEQKKADEVTQEVSGQKHNFLYDSRAEEMEGDSRRRNGRSTFLIVIILAFASICSMYESTLHTATYLYDYVDLISAWLLSTAVTAYNSSAFEVSVMFHNMKRNFMAFVFMLLWAMVTIFSMATTVSVFYDRFNFNETQIAQENKTVDSNKLGLELLRTKEKDLREAIDFKKKDIEYRQEREFATTAVRLELENLQRELQENLTEQQKLLEETPEVVENRLQKKESLFAFLGRMIGLEGGTLEFIMSTLSAIFINLIAPLSLTAVIELNKKVDKLN